MSNTSQLVLPKSVRTQLFGIKFRKLWQIKRFCDIIAVWLSMLGFVSVIIINKYRGKTQVDGQ